MGDYQYIANPDASAYAYVDGAIEPIARSTSN